MSAVAGAPEMVGAALAGPDTVILKGVSEALAIPSLTLITMPEAVPTFAAEGVPASCPVELLKLAHTGLPEIEKESVKRRGALADGVKL